MIGRRCCEGKVSEQARKLREVRKAALARLWRAIHLTLFSHPAPGGGGGGGVRRVREARGQAGGQGGPGRRAKKLIFSHPV